MGNIQRSIDTVLRIEDKDVAGQLNATLSRSASPVEITNQIKRDWAQNLTGTKSWQVSCNGVYINGATSFQLLEDAFMNDLEIDVIFTLGDKTYKGKGLIIDFPLNAAYNSQLKYSIEILGTGALICE